ncbi:MAG: NAD(P)H-binding protein [Verrucomicrobiae bacterium]|nr:NAD(P)H-binding protein [Verrucomicrobiae bacterium]
MVVRRSRGFRAVGGSDLGPAQAAADRRQPVKRHAVTGAFGYSGRYIAQRLLDAGEEVITLTNSWQRPNPFGDRLTAHPFHFDEPEQLVETLRGVSVLYNTYWVRFNHRTFTHADAVRNTRTLFKAAKAAGVERIVHVSITNPSEDCSLEYFRAKERLEQKLLETGVSHAILRPAVLFGREDILINNIAWTLRRFPVFGVFGDGRYRLQPIHVDDLAALAVTQGACRENVILNAIGPETFTYRDLVRQIGEIIGCRRPIIGVPPMLGYLVGRIVGAFVHDVMITRDEIKGLMADLLHVDGKAPPTGTTRLTDWAREHADTLGRHYTSELARRRDRVTAYASN